MCTMIHNGHTNIHTGLYNYKTHSILALYATCHLVYRVVKVYRERREGGHYSDTIKEGESKWKIGEGGPGGEGAILATGQT